MLDSTASPDNVPGQEGEAAVRAAAAAALRSAFTRLRPQGSDAWNFLAAFTHLGDRYGPYQPGASDLSKLVHDTEPGSGARLGTWKQRLRPKALGTGPAPGRPGDAGEQSELEEAMAQVVEAFRFLSARVRTLEERLAHEDRPIDGPAWLLPAQELGAWAGVIAGHIVDASPDGEVLHGDCGQGALVGLLREAGITARGAEPRGMVALAALERELPVAMIEVADELAMRPAASLGGLVLSGVVDRLPLHALVSLLECSRVALALGAPIVIVATDPKKGVPPDAVLAADLLQPRALHAETWVLLLKRAGFGGIGALEGAPPGDSRFALAASVPR